MNRANISEGEIVTKILPSIPLQWPDMLWLNDCGWSGLAYDWMLTDVDADAKSRLSVEEN